MFRFLILSFLLMAGWSQGTQQNVGTKVVRRYTTGTFAGGEITTYTIGDRRRTEYHNTAQHRNAGGSFEQADPSPNVVIQRCDLGKVLSLNTKVKQSSSSEYPPKPLTPEERNERGLDDPDWDTSTVPAFRVETKTVDTGEREEIFGQRARHVITTVTSTPIGGTKSEPSVFVTNGWYIDYDRTISCEPKPPAGPKDHDFAWFFTGAHRTPIQKIENIQVGERETGLLVRKEGQNSVTTTIKGSNGVNLSMSYDMQTTEFFKGPLDPALFEVPPEFKEVKTLPLH
jgi:hypothetical protein